MKTNLHRPLLALISGMLIAISACASSAEQGTSWLASKPMTPLWVVSRDARCWRFRIWVAQTPEEFTRGLMFVKALPEDGGMLFGLGDEREISMWMRNTLIPLDILFVDASGTIVKIHEDAEPLSLAQIRSGQAVFAVLELPGGATRQRDIQTGDRLRHAHFGNGGCQDT